MNRNFVYLNFPFQFIYLYLADRLRCLSFSLEYKDASCCFQTKYKTSGRQEAGCLYSVMPETLDTQRAKQVSQIQSQVLTAQHLFQRCQ